MNHILSLPTVRTTLEMIEDITCRGIDDKGLFLEVQIRGEYPDSFRYEGIIWEFDRVVGRSVVCPDSGRFASVERLVFRPQGA